MNTTRRAFSAVLPAAAAGLVFAQKSDTADLVPIAPDLVKDWVGKAHERKIDVMEALLKREPNLIQSSWDWGNGDWESGLQAAAHTGSREMALFLLERGARVDLFAAAMLGQLAMLKSAIDTFTASLQVRGAHGIPLLSHAVVVNLIGNTKTKAGLHIQSELDTKAYEIGIKVSDEELAAVRIKNDTFHGEWNYTISPNS